MSYFSKELKSSRYRENHRGLELVKQSEKDLTAIIIPFTLKEINRGGEFLSDLNLKERCKKTFKRCNGIFGFYLALWHSFEEYQCYLMSHDDTNPLELAFVENVTSFFESYSNKIITVDGRSELVRERSITLTKLLETFDFWLSGELIEANIAYQEESSRMIYITLLAIESLIPVSIDNGLRIENLLDKTSKRIESIHNVISLPQSLSFLNGDVSFEVSNFLRTLNFLKKFNSDPEKSIYAEIEIELLRVVDDFINITFPRLDEKIKQFNHQKNNAIRYAICLGEKNRFDKTNELELVFSAFTSELERIRNDLNGLIAGIERLSEFIKKTKNLNPYDLNIKQRQMVVLNQICSVLISRVGEELCLSQTEKTELENLDSDLEKLNQLRVGVDRKIRDQKFLCQFAREEVEFAFGLGLAFGEIIKFRETWSKKSFYHLFFNFFSPMYSDRVRKIEEAYYALISPSEYENTCIQREKTKIFSSEKELSPNIQESIGGFLSSNHLGYKWG